MTTRTFPFPAHPLRWWHAAPAAFGTMLAGLASILLRRTREPSLPKMSDEWLRNYDRDSGRDPDPWR